MIRIKINRIVFIVTIIIGFNVLIYFMNHQQEFIVMKNSAKLSQFNISSSFDPYIILTSEKPEESGFNPTVANGYIGYRLYSGTFYKNGLYNGRKGDSHRAKIPYILPYINPLQSYFQKSETKYSFKSISEQSYLLNMKAGFFSRIFHITGEKAKRQDEILCTVSQISYAHKFLTRLLVTEIIINFNVEGFIFLSLHVKSQLYSEDIEFDHVVEKHGAGVRGAKAVCGHTITPEQDDGDVSNVCFYTTNVPDEIVMKGKSGEKYSFSFITSISDNLKEARHYYILGVKLLNEGTLFATHENEWLKTWKYGSMLFDSEDETQMHSTVSGLYYLLSAFPPLSISEHPYEFFGASPGGLTNGGKDQDYFGHVFWDQDFWMLPALLPLFPDAVKQGLIYRVARLSMAKIKAADAGFKGAMYPWESAYTGMDVCPGKSYKKYEQHVTGDLIHTLRMYMYITGDWDFMFESIPDSAGGLEHVTPWDVVYETSLFWLSRAVWSDKHNAYVINEVMGPDEFNYPVNNSAFTNEVATQNLDFAIEVADHFDLPLPEKESFKKVANNLLIVYDSLLDYHPEFEGFDHKTDEVKQSDTIMLGFPLMSKNATKSSLKNDLEIYAKVTESDGPAMTWGMFSVNWNSLGQISLADKYFLKQYNNIQKPYQIWTEESSGGGVVNFLTGIGGYLQSVIYGYLGLRIYKNKLTLVPRLPPGLDNKEVSAFHIHGLKFDCSILDIDVMEIHFVVKLSGFRKNTQCIVLLKSDDSFCELSKIGNECSMTTTHLCEIVIK